MRSVTVVFAQLSAQLLALVVTDLQLKTFALARPRALSPRIAPRMVTLQASLLSLVVMTRVNPRLIRLADLLPQLLPRCGIKRGLVAGEDLRAGNRQERQQQEREGEEADARRHGQHCSCTGTGEWASDR